MADAEFLKDTSSTDLSIGLPEQRPEILIKPNIGVIGVGGAGGNAINNMIESGLVGASFIVANTDAQVMTKSLTHQRIQLGATLTQGLGAGSNPEIGRKAAEESQDKIKSALENLQMLFIAAGMGGGTGTGASPVIARIAKEMGILTVGVVTKPFHLEGTKKMRVAEAGIEELTKYVDTIIIIPNQNLFRIVKENTSFIEAFKICDDVLYQGVRSITDLMMTPMLINLDFADLTTVVKEMGKAMMGSGEAEGENRALIAAEKAIANPLLDVSMKGASGILINIAGGADLTLMEVDAAAERIRSEVAEESTIIFGASCDESLQGKIRVNVVATGLAKEKTTQQQTPTNLPLPIAEEKTIVITPPKQNIFEKEYIYTQDPSALKEKDEDIDKSPLQAAQKETSIILSSISLANTEDAENKKTLEADSFILDPAVIVSNPLESYTSDEEEMPQEESPSNQESEQTPIFQKTKTFWGDGFLPGIFGDRNSAEVREKTRLKREGLKSLTNEDSLSSIEETDIDIPTFLRRKSD